jgi:hypothetical protein
MLILYIDVVYTFILKMQILRYIRTYKTIKSIKKLHYPEKNEIYLLFYLQFFLCLENNINTCRVSICIYMLLMCILPS